MELFYCSQSKKMELAIRSGTVVLSEQCAGPHHRSIVESWMIHPGNKEDCDLCQ